VTVYLCHEQPELLDFEAEVTDTRPGAVLLSRSALHPGGGGQVCDNATLEHAKGVATITDVRHEGDRYWHVLDDPRAVVSGPVSVHIDAERRSVLSQLHTDTHLLNALIFDRYAGALVTGAQVNADGTARMDFDLAGVGNDELRLLEPALNDLIKSAAEVRAVYVPASEADTTPGLIRSMSVTPPPTPDGMLRIIEIAGVDRQACGGTHLANTAQSRPVQIIKVENKGRHNRRIRLRFAPGANAS
jgi:misacylated tRNA(Ala) deacylase